jgi:hypothetical protein
MKLEPTRRRGNGPAGILARLAAVTLLAGTIGAVPLLVSAADSEPLDLDPNLQALVAREKIKQRGATRRTDARAGLQNNGNNQNANCGSVDIGNATNDRSARNRVNPRDSTVIVTGPVVNAARCK